MSAINKQINLFFSVLHVSDAADLQNNRGFVLSIFVSVISFFHCAKSNAARENKLLVQFIEKSKAERKRKRGIGRGREGGRGGREGGWERERERAREREQLL